MIMDGLKVISANDAPYSFDHLVSEFKWLLKTIPDHRVGSNTTFSISDTALSAFSVFFMQSSSFLAHQMRMQELNSNNNARSLFQINHIPSDNQIRNLLDPISPEHMSPMFDLVFDGLKSMGYFEHYRSINKNILIALDGVNYFSSQKINCNQCNTRNHKSTGKTTYLHNAITPVIVAPNNPHVISLPPEFITPQDGHDKQDCEHAAAKRWLTKHVDKYKELKITLLGDDLYAHHPICDLINQLGLNYIFTCKPDSHKKLYQDLQSLDENGHIQTLQIERIEGKRKPKSYTDTYRFVNYVPMRGTENSVLPHWCELVTRDENDNIVFINSYVTSHEITKDSVIEIVKAGRTRWKTENENNNILKNHGYNMEHNFGHGKIYLSQLLLSLNLLAFLFHTILNIMDDKYKFLREKLPTRKIFFEHIKALTTYMFFDNWDTLLQFMIDGLNKKFYVSDIAPKEKNCESHNADTLVKDANTMTTETQ
jgi:hypothetical protein